MVNSPARKSAAVLVVDDEAILRMYASDFLTEAGFTAVEAESADEALKVMETRPDIHVLFTDIQMPGSMNGMELAQKIHDRWPNVLLLITSGNMRPAKANIPDHGHFLAKPYIANMVLREIRALEMEAAAR